jgi:branched-chain amino acid transport system substrate-binding protein
MKTKMIALAAAAAILAGGAANAQQGKVSGDVVKIGILTDMSGVYNAIAGKGSVAAAEMAVEDFGGKVLGKPIRIVSADHQNKPDVASATAREWIDSEGVDMITDIVTSSTGIAVQKLASDKGVITINTGAASTALTNAECTPLGVHYAYDTYSLAAGTVKPVIDKGGKKWFFITADYVFGHSLENNTADMVKKNGGQVVGGVRHPFPNTDFSSYLLQAQGSGANVIALANAGQDTTNAVRQAGEFGIGRGDQQLVGLLVFSSDVKSLGLKTAQGLQFVDSWYWDMNEETRKWSERFEKRTGAKPTSVQAADYSAVLQYLKAVEAAGTDKGKAVRAQLANMTMNDMYHKNAKLREDGRVLHDMYLMKAKSPKESKGEWDLLTVVDTIPAEKAFQPLSESTCKLVKKS